MIPTSISTETWSTSLFSTRSFKGPVVFSWYGYPWRASVTGIRVQHNQSLSMGALVCVMHFPRHQKKKKIPETKEKS